MALQEMELGAPLYLKQYKAKTDFNHKKVNCKLTIETSSSRLEIMHGLSEEKKKKRIQGN